MTQAYDAQRFDPPAPVASVTIKSKALGIDIQNVPMLMDTGAECSHDAIRRSREIFRFRRAYFRFWRVSFRSARGHRKIEWVRVARRAGRRGGRDRGVFVE